MGMLLYMMELEMAQKKENGVAEKVAPSPLKQEKQKVKEEKKPAQTPSLEITAEDIKKMTGPKLRKLAKENGVDSPEEYTVAELKTILCEKYS